MKRLYNWLLSRRRWLVLAVCSSPLVVGACWALSFRASATFAFVIIWFTHLALGVVAVVAGTRLWRSRHIPLLKWLWFYLNAFVIDVLSAIVLLFVARGVKFTWKFTAVMFVSTLLSDIARAPLLFSLIRGRADVPAKEQESSGELPPQVWHERFDRLEMKVQELIEQMRRLSNKREIT